MLKLSWLEVFTHLQKKRENEPLAAEPQSVTADWLQSVAASQVKYKLCNTLAWNFLMNPPWNADALLLTWCQFARWIRLSEGIFLSSKAKPCFRVVSTNDENLIINYERSGQYVCVWASVWHDVCFSPFLPCNDALLWTIQTVIILYICK